MNKPQLFFFFFSVVIPTCRLSNSYLDSQRSSVQYESALKKWGGAPNGWFLSWKIILFFDDLGVPLFQETSFFLPGLHVDRPLTIALEADPRKPVYVCRKPLYDPWHCQLTATICGFRRYIDWLCSFMLLDWLIDR